MDSPPAGHDQQPRRPVASALAALVCVAAFVHVGCDGPQSALAPAGRGAEQLAELFWWMAGGAAIVWAVVVGIAIYAIAIRPGPHDDRKTRTLIIGGGVIFPTIVLTALLAYGLSLLPELLEPAPEGSLRIAVSGEQWWWRVQYLPPDAQPFELANEIRLPVGQPVEFLLSSPDVIHAFWIPSLGGKVDMIPGRQTRLKLEPTKTGIFRGVCAEYCGESHSLMNFDVVVLEPEEFEMWMRSQAAPASAPSSPIATAGQQVFAETGCGACHTIRGTDADGRVGPDLTHVGSRLTIGAGILSNEPAEFASWIARTEAIKPGVHMPAFGMLPENEIRALAMYLEGLE